MEKLEQKIKISLFWVATQRILYQHTLRNNPEEQRPHLHRGGSLKCRKTHKIQYIRDSRFEPGTAFTRATNSIASVDHIETFSLGQSIASYLSARMWFYLKKYIFENHILSMRGRLRLLTNVC